MTIEEKVSNLIALFCMTDNISNSWSSGLWPDFENSNKLMKMIQNEEKQN